MQISRRHYDKYVILEITGILSVENISNFESSLNDCVKQDKNIIIDLASLKFIDSSSLGIIVLYFAKMEKIGKLLILSDINEDVQQMFSLTKIGKRVPIVDSNEEAIGIIQEAEGH